MACHEIAALRLGLMRVLGRTDEAERRHELAELGGVAAEAGPIKTLCETQDLASLKRKSLSIATTRERSSARRWRNGSRRPRPATPSCPISARSWS